MSESFGRRGTDLWVALEASRDLEGGNATLALEACRIADRLDGLERVLSGDVSTWLELRLPDPDGREVIVTVDKALSEARQQAIVLRQIVAGLPMKGDDDDTDGIDPSALGMPA